MKEDKIPDGFKLNGTEVTRLRDGVTTDLDLVKIEELFKIVVDTKKGLGEKAEENFKDIMSRISVKALRGLEAISRYVVQRYYDADDNKDIEMVVGVSKDPGNPKGIRFEFDRGVLEKDIRQNKNVSSPVILNNIIQKEIDDFVKMLKDSPHCDKVICQQQKLGNKTVITTTSLPDYMLRKLGSSLASTLQQIATETKAVGLDLELNKPAFKEEKPEFAVMLKGKANTGITKVSLEKLKTFFEGKADSQPEGYKVGTRNNQFVTINNCNKELFDEVKTQLDKFKETLEKTGVVKN